MSELNVQRVEEFSLSDHDHRAIGKLLRSCFSSYPPKRSYYKQLPDFRFLVHQKEQLIAHMAVEHRLINISGMVASAFGVVDLCVSKDFRDQGVGGRLLKELENLGRSHQIDFLVLLASEHEIYQKHGFRLVHNTCRWLMINEHQTLGVGHRRLESCILIKPLGKKEWREGLVDFLGYVF